jgi:hypothetical protein
MSRLDVLVGCEDFSSQSLFKGQGDQSHLDSPEKKDPDVSVARKPTFTTKWTNEGGWSPISGHNKASMNGE